MRFYSEKLSTDGSAFGLLCDLVHERTGNAFDNGRRELLGEKLSPLVLDRGFSTFLDYYYFLKYDGAAEAEWRRLMDAISVQETFLWREAEQILATARTVVSRHEAFGGGRPLRIWSAACATGEEPISITIALEEGGWFDRIPIEIVASDGSDRAIARARRGIVTTRAMRAMPPLLREKYFVECTGGWRVDPAIHGRVQWRHVNLLAEEETAGLAASDVIFCRNVFIYFSEATIRRVVAHFFNRMPAPGYLFLAAAESILRITEDFAFRELGGAFAYVKDCPSEG